MNNDPSKAIEDFEKLTKMFELLANIKDVCVQMSRETERGRVLIGQEHLSMGLETLLRAKFMQEEVKRNDLNKLLKGFAAPFGTFSMRTIVCRAFGLLSHETCDHLDAYRAIRNHCAHSDRQVTLNDPEIANQVRVLENYNDAPGVTPSDMLQGVVIGLTGAVMKSTRPFVDAIRERLQQKIAAIEKTNLSPPSNMPPSAPQ